MGTNHAGHLREHCITQSHNSAQLAVIRKSKGYGVIRSTEGKFACGAGDCKYRTNVLSALKIHHRRCLDNSSKLIKTEPLCDEKLNSKKVSTKKKKSSKRKCHSDTKKWYQGLVYKCTLCDTTFNNYDSMHYHIKKGHKTDSAIRPYTRVISKTYHRCLMVGCRKKLLCSRESIRVHMKLSHEICFGGT